MRPVEAPLAAQSAKVEPAAAAPRAQGSVAPRERTVQPAQEAVERAPTLPPAPTEALVALRDVVAQLHLSALVAQVVSRAPTLPPVPAEALEVRRDVAARPHWEG